MQIHINSTSVSLLISLHEFMLSNSLTHLQLFSIWRLEFQSQARPNLALVLDWMSGWSKPSYVDTYQRVP